MVARDHPRQANDHHVPDVLGGERDTWKGRPETPSPRQVPKGSSNSRTTPAACGPAPTQSCRKNCHRSLSMRTAFRDSHEEQALAVLNGLLSGCQRELRA